MPVSIQPQVYVRPTILAKKNQNQDIHSRLRELTEETRRTRRELEELIRRPDGHVRAVAADRTPFFRRRRVKAERPK